MLTEEHILIVTLAYQLHSELNEQISTVYLNFNFSFSIGLLQADESQNTSTAESSNVGGNCPNDNTIRQLHNANLHFTTLVLTDK